jgi:hypothetical protein
MNQQQWISRLQKLAKSRNRSNWELGDVLSQGETEYGKKPCYDLAQKATGYYRGSLYRIAGVAAYFPARLRFENLSWLTYVALRAFPLPFLEKFLPPVADSELSAKIIREKAVAEYGSDPEPHRRPKKYNQVRIAHSLCIKLVERAGTSKVSGLVTQILEEWLVGEKCERYSTNANKTREWNQKVKDAGAETVAAQKDAGPDTESVGNDVQSAQTQPEAPIVPEKRPTYAERRKNWNPETKSYDQPAEKPAFVEHKYTCKHKLLFTPCKPDAWVDGEIPTQFSKRKIMATRFKTRELADIAAREYQEDRGYAIESMRCEVCKCWHIVGKNFGLFKAAEIDLTKEQREVRVTVEDALQQHAQA